MSDFEDNDKDAKKHFVKAIEAKVEVHTFQFPDFTDPATFFAWKPEFGRAPEEEARIKYSEEGIRELGRALEEEMRILEEGKYRLVKERVGNVIHGKFRKEDWR